MAIKKAAGRWRRGASDVQPLAACLDLARPRAMKITFVLPLAQMTGGTRVVAEHASELARRGHEVLVLSQPARRPGWRATLKSLLQQWRMPPYQRTEPSFLDAAAVTHRVCRRHGLRAADLPDGDVVVATWWETAEWVQRLPDSKGRKLYFVQGHEVFPMQPLERVRATYRLPMQIVAVSQWLRKVLASEYGRRDVGVVPNAIDHDQFRFRARPKNAEPVVGFIYSHAGTKGLETLLAGIECLRLRVPNLRIVAFGQAAWSEPALPGLSYQRDPAQAAIADLYAQCDVWLNASVSEGYGLPVVEALACGTPVVATRTGWAADGIVDGHNGRLVDFNDAVGLADAAASLLALEPAPWAALSARCAASVAHLDWTQCTQRFEQLLGESAWPRPQPGIEGGIAC